MGKYKLLLVLTDDSYMGSKSSYFYFDLEVTDTFENLEKLRLEELKRLKARYSIRFYVHSISEYGLLTMQFRTKMTNTTDFRNFNRSHMDVLLLKGDFDEF